jgi:hypothetical protein
LTDQVIDFIGLVLGSGGALLLVSGSVVQRRREAPTDASTS